MRIFQTGDESIVLSPEKSSRPPPWGRVRRIWVQQQNQRWQLP